MKPRIDRRGLQVLRTNTSRKAIPTQKKHELYLKLTTLEMEKARRITERDAILKRLAMIEERLQTVTSEQLELLEIISSEEHAMNIANQSSPPQTNSHAFPIQY